MLSFNLKASPLCNTLLKHQSAHKQVLGSNTLYTHRLPLTEKHLPTVAARHYVEPYFNSVASEALKYFTHQHGNLCHRVSDFQPTTAKRRKEDAQWNWPPLWQGQSWFCSCVFFVYIFAKYISQRQEMPMPEILLLETANAGFLCALLSVPMTFRNPHVCGCYFARLWQHKEFRTSQHYFLFVFVTYFFIQ